MKSHYSLFTVACFLVLGTMHAQVEVDKPILMTGATGERSISNLEAPVDGNDAVNKDYVDNAVAATGGSGMPTMISDQSAASYTYVPALAYCRTLNEGGHSDWHLPSFDELTYILSKGGTVVSNPTSNATIWFREPIAYGNGTYTRWGLNLGSSSLDPLFWSGGSSAYVRCVR